MTVSTQTIHLEVANDIAATLRPALEKLMHKTPAWEAKTKGEGDE